MNNTALTLPQESVITTQGIGSLYDVATKGDPETSQKLFLLLDNIAITSTKDIENLRKRQAVAMWLAELVWDYLGFEVTTQWEDFYGWATERTGLDVSTVRNRIRAARVFYRPGLRLPDRVDLRDRKGNPILDERGTFVSVNPDIYQVPISKLVLTATTFEEGRLTEVQLGMLLNPKVSHKALHKNLQDKKLLMAGNPIMRVVMEGTQLVAIEDGKQVAFGELNLWDKDPLVQKGISHVLIGSGIVTP